MPAGFRASDPSDPRYQWTTIDSEVRAAAAKGFLPLVCVQGAPSWAQTGGKQRPNDGPVRPSPSALADFASAFATRYSGSYGGSTARPLLAGLERTESQHPAHAAVRERQAGFTGLVPRHGQRRGGARCMLFTTTTSSSRAVSRRSVVTPTIPSGGEVPNQERIHPLEFMRQMLCMSGGSKPKPTCNAKSEFDVWSHHPYTYGGPTHKAFHPDDVSLGDLGEMRSLLERS